jgi:hypothetical protein
MDETNQRSLPSPHWNASPVLIALCIALVFVATVASFVTLLPGYLPGAFLAAVGLMLNVGNTRLTPGARSANGFFLSLLLLLDLLLIFAGGI